MKSIVVFVHEGYLYAFVTQLVCSQKIRSTKDRLYCRTQCAITLHKKWKCLGQEGMTLLYFLDRYATPVCGRHMSALQTAQGLGSTRIWNEVITKARQARWSQVLTAKAGAPRPEGFCLPHILSSRRDTPLPHLPPHPSTIHSSRDSWPWVQQAALPFAWPSQGFTVLIQFISLRDTRLAPRVSVPPIHSMPFSCPLAAYIKRICLQLTPLMYALSHSQLNVALKKRSVDGKDLIEKHRNWFLF